MRESESERGRVTESEGVIVIENEKACERERESRE